MTSRIAVLASGAGSNLQALLAHLARPGTASTAAVALVASDRATAGALGIAKRHGLAAYTLKDPQDATELLNLLRDHDITLVVLAGYLKRVPEAVTRLFRGRMLNVHPALLPAFGGPGMYGRRVHDAVIASGLRVSGVTVHFVDEHYDHGAIVAQWPVPVRSDDTPRTLASRVLQIEHHLYPCAVSAVASGRVTLDPSNRVRGEVIALPSTPAFALHTEDDQLPCAP